jgi:hypothetical protein
MARSPGVRILVAALAVQIALGAGLVLAAVNGFPLIGGAPDEPAPQAAAADAHGLRTNRFDARRAFAELRRQVALGPRPAGSRASRRLARRLRTLLPDGRFEGVPGGLRNVVGSIPGSAPAIAIAAHYDTKDLPGFVGANDGAGGTAAVLELARVLRRAERPAGAPELRFLLFDGEEAADDTEPFLESGVRGSRAYAAAHRGELRSLVLLDFVADRDLRILRESGSDAALWSELRAAARTVGAARAFPAGTIGTVQDDHTPFTARGVPAIDLIDISFACFHRTCDDMGAVSARSLDFTGETVYELVRRLGAVR